ncbi:LysR family transcriptional regulator ArgP [Pusillimonas sp. ANT_WB101]|uniref:LysR family transcriptional regulator ArgP n=1 Tax=Pusillimonas sp. ANT_WB101 TaxID=2597356 RepID=UPI0011ED3F83|nr:LysR family transcriptional regulator ArgP [Pusillimonas sp. ANT_WB101]KAA0892975.1 LysR family transcriptional regulator ArgP [Pusillimonas sp. ANT_WB101]
MNLDHGNLRALAAVVREGSFERAAAVLNVTPSAVSQRIKLLEGRMGRLLVQRTVPTAATPDGQILVHLAEQAALLEHDALSRLGFDEDIPQASIAIAVNHDSLETWFMQAAALFSARTNATLDLQSEDQDHTAALLRNGTVLGAVTTLGEPVQGCHVHRLGSMRYVATCSPAFHDKYFAKGVSARTLAEAPVLVFNRKDAMQARFALKVMGEQPWRPPVWWLPSSRAFVRATLDGLGWTMNPLPMVEQELNDGLLVPLRARAWEDVPLYWQHWRINSQAMNVLNQSVLEASKSLIHKR